MNDELAVFRRLNLKRHPILRAIYDAVQAIEECGASTKLTDAVYATTRLSEMAATLLDERDAALADAQTLQHAKEVHQFNAELHAKNEALQVAVLDMRALLRECRPHAYGHLAHRIDRALANEDVR